MLPLRGRQSLVWGASTRVLCLDPDWTSFPDKPDPSSPSLGPREASEELIPSAAADPAGKRNSINRIRLHRLWRQRCWWWCWWGCCHGNHPLDAVDGMGAGAMGGTPDLRRDRRDQARRTTGKSGVEVLTRWLPSVTAERLMGSEGGENTSGKVRKKPAHIPRTLVSLDQSSWKKKKKSESNHRNSFSAATLWPRVCRSHCAAAPSAQAAYPKMHLGWALLQLRG